MYKLKNSVIAFIGFALIGAIAAVMPHSGFAQDSQGNGATKLNCGGTPCDAR